MLRPSLKRLSLSAKLDIRPSELAGAPGGGATTTYSRFSKQQLHDQWCWAAVGAAMGNYYQGSQNGPNWPPYTQQEVASAGLGIYPGTCQGTSEDPPQCNKSAPLETSLIYVGTFDRAVDGAPATQSLRIELTAGRPFGVRLDTNSGTVTGHSVVIGGYQAGSVPMWQVCDPWGGFVSMIAVDQFPSKYPHDRNTTWSHTFYTKLGQPHARPVT